MEELLAKTVVLNGLKVGRVVDVLLAPDGKAVVGLEVRCGDGQHRFLPKAAAVEGEDTIEIDSPFALLDTDELGFYHEQGRTLRTRRESAA
jgi:sporulation protein YlmC with PRC-barrel domain